MTDESATSPAASGGGGSAPALEGWPSHFLSASAHSILSAFFFFTPFFVGSGSPGRTRSRAAVSSMAAGEEVNVVGEVSLLYRKNQGYRAALFIMGLERERDREQGFCLLEEIIQLPAIAYDAGASVSCSIPQGGAWGRPSSGEREREGGWGCVVISLKGEKGGGALRPERMQQEQRRCGLDLLLALFLTVSALPFGVLSLSLCLSLSRWQREKVRGIWRKAEKGTWGRGWGGGSDPLLTAGGGAANTWRRLTGRLLGAGAHYGSTPEHIGCSPRTGQSPCQKPLFSPISSALFSKDSTLSLSSLSLYRCGGTFRRRDRCPAELCSGSRLPCRP